MIQPQIRPNIKPHPALPLDASYPEILAASKEDETSDWKFRRNILNQLPESFGIKIAGHYAQLYEDEGRRIANLYMLDVQDDLSFLTIKLSASDDDLVAYAKKAAEHCVHMRRLARNDEIAFYALELFNRKRYGISPPLMQKHHARKGHSIPVTVSVTVTENQSLSVPVTLPVTGILNRWCDEHWWRRTLRNIHIRNVEKHAIRSGFVQRNVSLYVSEETHQRYIQQQKRNKRVLEQCFAVNEITGEEFNLLELAKHSIANPSNRRAELMVRIRGFEELSKELKHIAMFYTITCPSRMHAYTIKTLADGKTISIRNPKYDNTTPEQAQRYLSNMWKSIRSKIDRNGLMGYGLRVVEAHHDGTPHWHLLVFMPAAHESAYTQTLRSYALRENPNEPGADKHRFKAEKIDPKKGSATGYIAKYISKGLDGFGMDLDLYGEDAVKSAGKVRAWASTWGIRQYQQVGGPSVTIYRELRRIKGDELNGMIAEIFKAADSGDWQNFVKLMGGPNMRRKDCPVKVLKKWSDKPNRYQEPSGYQIIGLDFNRVVIVTRTMQWKIEYRRKKETRPVAMAEETRTTELPVSDGVSRGLLAPLEFCQ